MKAVQLVKSIPRYAATRAIGALYAPIYWSSLAMLRYRHVPEPQLPGPEWVKIKTRYGGICGSDINAVFLNDSPTLTALVSFPFTLGHENVGTIAEVGANVDGYTPGDRVVVEPLLPCVTRGINPVCEYCQRGAYALCQNFAEGDLKPGLSIGHCADTGGSWSPYFLAHKSQLFRLHDQVSDENAVLIDPFCTTLHPVMRNFPQDSDHVLILGAGVIGLCTLKALRILGSQAWITIVAKYPFQAEMANLFGADEVVNLHDDDLDKIVTSRNDGKLYQPVLGKALPVGGADVVFECVGNAGSIDDSLRLTRSSGTVVLIGLASKPRGVDWTPIWMNELTIKGSYWCSTELLEGQPVRTFQIALDWIAQGKLDLSSMLTHRFRLDDYKNALATTTSRGKNQVIKSTFTFD